MFGGVFEIKDAELGGIYFHDTSSLKLLFKIKGIPEKHPKKWAGNDYNAMSLVLVFDGIKKFKANGRRINFACSPEINSSVGMASINIKNGDFNISCESEFLTIEGITPYIDERWD